LDFWAIFGRFIEDALAMVEVAFAEPGKSGITGFLSDIHLRDARRSKLSKLKKFFALSQDFYSGFLFHA